MTALRTLFVILVVVPVLSSQPPLLDSQGRHFFPHGFVTLTGDAQGIVVYTPADYRHMAELGANVQVIRIFFGKIGAWPGYDPDPEYLAQVAEMVEMGKQAGISSLMKLTVYDVPGFSHANWSELWHNKDNRQQRLVEAWERVFRRFKDEPAVLGYDLINEPIRGDIDSNQVFVRDYLVPIYRRLCDALQAISPEKWALYQPPLLEPRQPWDFPFGRFEVAIERSHVLYAPHYYGPSPATAVDRYQREALLSNAPFLVAEHGDATTPEADTNLEQQQAYFRRFTDTVTTFDRNTLGGVKPWFCGSRVHTKSGATWAVFAGKTHAGGAERKYVIDVVARPKPHYVAGRVERYEFNFASRKFEMIFTPDPAKGESAIYIPLNRHYPDGFRIVYGRGVTLAYDPGAPSGLRIIENKTGVDPTCWRWDEPRSRLVISSWDKGSGSTSLRIVPGTME